MLGEASVQIVPDLSKFVRQLQSGLEDAFDKVKAEAERTGESIEESFVEAARASELSIESLGDAEVWSEIGAGAERAGEQVEDAFREAARTSENALDGIGGKLKGIAAGLAATAAAAGIGKVFQTSIDLASDLGESINAVNVTFGDAAGGINKLGEQAATSLGLSQAEFNGLAVRFSAFTKTIAGDGGDVVATMQDLTTRAADFASVMNLEVNDAAQLFQSGLAGETEPLRKYGIDLSAAAVENYALAKGIATSAGELTEAQKVQARYGLLMEATAKTQGDFANTSDGLANQMRILKAQLKDTGAEFGAALLPGVTSVATAFNQLLPTLGPALAEIGKVIGQALGPIFEQIGPSIGTLAETIGMVVGDISQVFSALAPLIEPIVEIVSVLATVFSGALANAFTALAPAIEVVAGFLGDLAAMMEGELFDLVDALVPVMLELGKVIGNTFRILAPVLLQVAEALTGVLSEVLTALAPVLPILADAFNRILVALLPLIPPLLEIVTALLPPLAELVAAIVPLIAGGLAVAVETLAPLLVDVAEALATVAGWMGDLIGFVAGLLSGTQNFGEVFRSVWQGILDFFRGIWEGIKGVVDLGIKSIKGYIRGITAVFTEVWDGIKRVASSVWDGMVAGFKGVVNGMLATIEGGLNFLIRGLNLALDAIDKAAGPWVNFGEVPEVKLPRLADGGIVTGPMVAQIGEAGAEAVIPLTRPTRAAQIMQQAGLTGMGGAPLVTIEQATFATPTDMDLLAQKLYVAYAQRTLAA